MKKAYIKDIDLAWIAACIDCDGCIGIYRMKCKSHPWGVYAYLQFTNDSKDMIKRFIEILKCGNVYHWKDKKTLKHHYNWKLRDVQKLSVVLPQIIPYLILKKRKAQILLQYAKLRLKKGLYSRYSIEEYNLVEEIKNV